MTDVWTHEPATYVCPFCALVAGSASDVLRASDIIAETDRALAFVSPRWWEGNEGHVLVIPRAHHENLYNTPVEDLAAVFALVQRVARAIRSTYECTGTSVRQHNEPHGNQDVWHFHAHVFPRHDNDRLYERAPIDGFADPDRRAAFASRLRPLLAARGHAAAQAVHDLKASRDIRATAP
jgi:histidine triad (HIT) family protein